MSMPTREALLSRLAGELEYPPAQVEDAANRMLAFRSPVRELFLRWWTTGETPDTAGSAETAIEGYTMARLMNDYGMEPLGALLTLDWLMREPEIASTALAEGFDDIVWEE
jgi:hypothetical protein